MGLNTHNLDNGAGEGPVAPPPPRIGWSHRTACSRTEASIFSDSPNGHTTTAPPRAPRVVHLGDLLAEWRTEAEAAYAAHEQGIPRGPVTGHKKLDEALGGVLQPGLHLILGGPGVGKTAGALQIAAACGATSLYLSCEMGLLELLRRHTARVTGTYLGRLKSGELHPKEAERLVQLGVEAAPHLVLADATQAYADPDWIRDAAEATRGDRSNHLLIVVDSVHSWVEASPSVASEYDALNAGIAALRQIAAELRCPILAIAERNRASMAKGGMNAAAGSRRFEYGAETVLDLQAEPDAVPDMAGEIAVTLKIEKNRNGAPGRKIPLKFHGALQRFREPDA
jgi:replicative DNA helicase